MSGKAFNLKKPAAFKHTLLKDSYVPIYDQFIKEITKYNDIDDSKYVADLCMVVYVCLFDLRFTFSKNI